MEASVKVALFVGGIVRLIRLRRGVWVGREEASMRRTGLTGLGLGEMYGLLQDVGLGSDSFDNRSTSVNFANPREDDCCVARSEVWGD
jgi:hypothetical protein